jgi:hypothetical protein
MNIILPIIIFVAWFAFMMIPAGQLAVDDARKQVPKERRRGTSILPGFPLFPLIAWGAASFIDQFISPWGTRVILGLHGVMLVISILYITREIITLRRVES